MTPEEFAQAHGLSLEEAELILAARQSRQAVRSPQKPSRLSRGAAVLEAAQRKTGVHPVTVSEAGIQKGYDEVAEENLDKFYQNKGGVKSTQGKFGPPVEDASQDPEDW